MVEQICHLNFDHFFFLFLYVAEQQIPKAGGQGGKGGGGKKVGVKNGGGNGGSKYNIQYNVKFYSLLFQIPNK